MIKTFSFSHSGSRSTNEDVVTDHIFSNGDRLLLVVDGMGGYSSGDKAAKSISESIVTYFNSTNERITPYHIQKAINKANLMIRQLSNEFQEKMGATVGGVLIGKGKAIAFWVGDVKILRFSSDELIFESNDHTLLNRLKISHNSIVERVPSNVHHIVTRSVSGSVEQSECEIQTFMDLDDNTSFIVCSDGVTEVFEPIQISELLRTSETREGFLSEIESYLLNQSKDNFSLIAYWGI